MPAHSAIQHGMRPCDPALHVFTSHGMLACVQVPGLSASGSEPLKLEFRNLNKIRRHLAKK